MQAPRGMTLIDVLVGTAIVLIVFLALFGLLRASILISTSVKAKSGATAVAQTQVEYIRSLAYDSVGTVGGIPAGPVPQYATTTLNGIPYVVRTLIQYVDDPKDGLATNDSNGIVTDYKRIRVTTTYIFRETEREVVVVSNVAPPSIETTAGGGTLRVQVVDAAGGAVAGAGVRVYNPSLSPSVDVTTFTDSTGAIILPGAPTSTDYRITVTKDGFSTAQTYARDSTNQNPTPGYLTVVGNQTTASTFAIDELATFILRTFSPIRATSTLDTFTTQNGLATLSQTSVVGGALTLAGAPGSYALSGTARSVAITPQYLSEWTELDVVVDVPVGTEARVFVRDQAGTLLPNAVLPGNESGFSSFPVPLSGVATTTYPSLVLDASLTTTASTTAPSILAWELTYDEGPVPLPNISYTLTGAKTIGTTGGGAPIYKTTIATTTSATGVRSHILEWDFYSISIPGYVALNASTTVAIDPGSATSSDLILEPTP